MYQSRIVNTVQVAARDFTVPQPGGVAAECPTCHSLNVANFGADGSLVWWPNADVGTWCRHAQGVYSAGGIRSAFQFIDGRSLQESG